MGGAAWGRRTPLARGRADKMLTKNSLPCVGWPGALPSTPRVGVHVVRCVEEAQAPGGNRLSRPLR